MKENRDDNNSKQEFSRRKFLTAMGTTTAGLLAAPYLKSVNVFAYGHKNNASYLAKVAVTQATNYDRVLIKQKVQHLFESIDGIGDIVSAGKKVAIKLNLTGGSGSAFNPKLQGKSITESVWTHPEVVRAVGELIIDCGVKGSDIYIVEALWDDASYDYFGYKDVQTSLGANKIDLNKTDPYTSFVDREVGPNKFHYSSFKMNQILADVDVFVSIPKLKHHYEAGFTGAIKNQIGIVPKSFYETSNQSRRDALHTKDGTVSSTSHLPVSICDLYFARTVTLSVIDGIMNAHGGEGTWNPTFKLAEDHIMLAGKNAVATDSVSAYFLGNNPEEPTFTKPDGAKCDNHLYMLNQKGAGTNKINEIEIVGDGASLITDVKHEYDVSLPTRIELLQNFPNPFNPATIISFYTPASEFVTIKIYNIAGQEIETLVNGEVPAGQHELHWNAKNLASGVYIYQMQARNYSSSKKMIYQK